jgi:hypothetical protein
MVIAARMVGDSTVIYRASSNRFMPVNGQQLKNALDARIVYVLASDSAVLRLSASLKLMEYG